MTKCDLLKVYNEINDTVQLTDTKARIDNNLLAIIEIIFVISRIKCYTKCSIYKSNYYIVT